MAVVKPFRALRYNEAAAGPLADLVAPPYDVITPEQREELRARSRHNVVHLTLPDAEEDAARELERWRTEEVLIEEPPAVWALEQEYVGPDGVSRTRFGLVASLKVEPYSTGTVLPHERTHAEPKAGRLRLLRATRVQLEPDSTGEEPVGGEDLEPRVGRGDEHHQLLAARRRPFLFAEGDRRLVAVVAVGDQELLVVEGADDRRIVDPPEPRALDLEVGRTAGPLDRRGAVVEEEDRLELNPRGAQQAQAPRLGAGVSPLVRQHLSLIHI